MRFTKLAFLQLCLQLILTQFNKYFAQVYFMPVLATGFPDLNPARAVPIPRERAGFTKSYNPAGFLGNSRDTELRAEPRCTQIGD